MARLHEHQGKNLLEKYKIPIPKGGAATSKTEAKEIAKGIGGEVVVKAQAWITGRAGIGAIGFARTPEEAAEIAGDMLGMQIKNFSVDTVLIEEKLSIKQEFYAGVIIDDQAQAPVMIFSSIGGSGVEEIAQEHPDAVARQVIDIRVGLLDYQARDLIRQTGVQGKLQMGLGNILVKVD
jgi:succinyl-CoA synthetase beta subunit